MPRDKLQDIIDESISDTSQVSEFELLDAQYERMYEVFEEVKQGVCDILCFGPSNSKEVELLESRLFSKPNMFNTLSFTTEAEQKAYLAILSRNKIHKAFPLASLKKSNEEKLKQFIEYGFISGTGTCEVYAAIAAVLLCQKYDVDVSIVNIHSDLTHTFLKVNTQPAFIFDFWSDSLTKEGDWGAWNESHDYDYRYSLDARFTNIMEHVPQSFLKELANRLNDPDILEMRRRHHASLLNQLSLTEDKQSSLEISPHNVFDDFDSDFSVIK